MIVIRWLAGLCRGYLSRRAAARDRRHAMVREANERRARDAREFWNSGEAIVDRFGR